LLMFSSSRFPSKFIQSWDETREILCKLVLVSGFSWSYKGLQIHKLLGQWKERKR